MERFDEIRGQLHLQDKVIAVNAGSWGPLCESARRAIIKGYQDEAASRGDNPELMKLSSGLGRYDTIITEAKKTVGVFLTCSPDEVALCDSSTTAMNIFLWGIKWRKGDEILTCSLENPAAMIPIKILEERMGVKLKIIDQGNGEHDSSEAICESINHKTRFVLISDVNYATGGREDLTSISKAAHDSCALVLADGVQAVGTSEVNVQQFNVDGYALNRHKFLCGPDGAGALFIRKEVLDEVKPTYSGVFSSIKHASSDKVKLHPSAQRYEVSTRPLPVIEGGTAAMEWIRDEIGLPFILKHTQKLYQELWDRLTSIPGVKVFSKRYQRSLLSFTIKGIESKKVVEKLREDYIYTRVIEATKPHCVRISIGFWNRNSDIEKIEKAVKTIAHK
ncbi:aminotransferase class V-fold PLP-dependent enzyme [Candidatus Bathyarchaeota archaeon]|nr:aminotransferase class V-fold PLP-dependent enzyme [Candidatus Bathyarchaeota archaeon]